MATKLQTLLKKLTDEQKKKYDEALALEENKALTEDQKLAPAQSLVTPEPDRPEHENMKKTLSELAPKWSIEERAVVLGALKQQEVQDLITGGEFEELAAELGYSQSALSHLGSLSFLEN